MDAGKHWKQRKRQIGVLLIFCGLTLGYLLLRSRLDPLVRDLAVTGARNAVTLSLQEAILNRSKAGELDYERFIRLLRDNSGWVTAAIADMGSIHAAASALSLDVIAAMQQGNASDLSVPLGNLLGVPLLSGYGPEISIRVLSVSDAEIRMASSFTDAGINQTLHRIVVELSAEVYVLIPGETLVTEVYAQMPIAETLIVGQVPESYMYFESGENWDEPLEQFDILS